MPTTYYLSSANSDLGGGDDFSKALVKSGASSGSLNFAVAAGSAEVSYAYTPSGDPGTAAGDDTVNFTIKVEILNPTNESITLGIYLARVDSSGAVQSGSSLSSTQALTAPGTYTFTYGAGLGTWASGDRLRIGFQFANSDTEEEAPVTIGFGGDEENSVVAPWDSVTGYEEIGACESGSETSGDDNVGLLESGGIEAASSIAASVIIGLLASGAIVSDSSVSANEILGLYESGSVSGGSSASAQEVVGLVESGSIEASSSVSGSNIGGFVESGAITGGASAAAQEQVGLYESGSIAGGSSVSGVPLSGYFESGAIEAGSSCYGQEQTYLVGVNVYYLESGAIESDSQISACEIQICKRFAPYRSPCLPCSSKPRLYLGGCYQHEKTDEKEIALWLNSQAGLVSPTVCEVCSGGALIDGNCYTPKLDQPGVKDFSDCHKTGWKAVRAQHVYHGQLPFDFCYASATTGTPDLLTVKYLLRRMVVEFEQWINKTPATNNRDVYGKLEWAVEMNKRSGVGTLTTWVPNPWTVTLPTDDPEDPNDAYSQMLLPWDSVADPDGSIWFKWLTSLVCFEGYGDQCTPMMSIEQLSKGLYENSTDTQANFQSTFFPSLLGDTLTSCTIEVTGAHFSVDVIWSNDDDPPPTNTRDSHLHIEGWLDNDDQDYTYTVQDFITDMGALMSGAVSAWDMTDDVQYPWRTDGNCTRVPVVKYDGASTPQTIPGPASETWTDPLTYTGAIVGGPLPDGYGTHYQHTDALGWNPGDGIPDTATVWNTDTATAYPGAWLSYSGGIAVAQQWAGIAEIHESLNYFRPCGVDRDVIDERDASYEAEYGVGVSYCDALADQVSYPLLKLYPTARAICGHIEVESFSQGGPDLEVTLKEEATYLRTGDQVEFEGVSITGPYTVTVTDSTHFTTLAFLPENYEGNGYVKTYGLPDATWWRWDDDRPKGDVIFLEWLWDMGADPDTYVMTCTQTCIQRSACCPSVMAVQITAQDWCNAAVKTFPSIASFSQEDAYFWQAFGVGSLPDAFEYFVDQDCDLLTTGYNEATWVEARCSKPCNAAEPPALPESLYDPPGAGGCFGLDQEWT